MNYDEMTLGLHALNHGHGKLGAEGAMPVLESSAPLFKELTDIVALKCFVVQEVFRGGAAVSMHAPTVLLHA